MLPSKPDVVVGFNALGSGGNVGKSTLSNELLIKLRRMNIPSVDLQEIDYDYRLSALREQQQTLQKKIRE